MTMCLHEEKLQCENFIVCSDCNATIRTITMGGGYFVAPLATKKSMGSVRAFASGWPKEGKREFVKLVREKEEKGLKGKSVLFLCKMIAAKRFNIPFVMSKETTLFGLSDPLQAYQNAKKKLG